MLHLRRHPRADRKTVRPATTRQDLELLHENVNSGKRVENTRPVSIVVKTEPSNVLNC